jgi:hypothetical protein
MSTAKPRALLKLEYFEAAQEYLRSLPPEHFMEATAQATQRAITLASLDQLKPLRPDLHLFNELLVQYPLARPKKLGQVVPDNMLVVWHGDLKADTSYDLPLQPVGPFCVLEYVSRLSKRKDYEESFRKYERDLKVPYYLVFYPDDQELTLYQLRGRKYVSVKPNEHGRYAIAELDLAIALHERWARYWYKGELLPLPADWRRYLDMERARRAQAEQRAAHAEQRAAQAEQRADGERQARLAAEEELEQLRAQLARREGRPGKGT